MTPHELTSQWWDHATMWNVDDPYLSSAGHSTDGGRVIGITRMRYAECNRYRCTPVAVLDPSDPKAVARLAELIAVRDEIRHGVELSSEVRGWLTDDVHCALVEFASVSPTELEEPTNLGAVVEDADGARFIRVLPPEVGGTCWRLSGDRKVSRERTWRWSDIAAVRVLSEGVQ